MGFFVKLVAVLGILFGIVAILLGVVGLAGGQSVRFVIGGEEVSPQKGGMIFTGIGIIALLIGIVCYHYGFRKKRKLEKTVTEA